MKLAIILSLLVALVSTTALFTDALASGSVEVTIVSQGVSLTRKQAFRKIVSAERSAAYYQSAKAASLRTMQRVLPDLIQSLSLGGQKSSSLGRFDVGNPVFRCGDLSCSNFDGFTFPSIIQLPPFSAKPDPNHLYTVGLPFQTKPTADELKTISMAIQKSLHKERDLDTPSLATGELAPVHRVVSGMKITVRPLVFFSAQSSDQFTEQLHQQLHRVANELLPLMKGVKDLTFGTYDPKKTVFEDGISLPARLLMFGHGDFIQCAVEVVLQTAESDEARIQFVRAVNTLLAR